MLIMSAIIWLARPDLYRRAFSGPGG